MGKGLAILLGGKPAPSEEPDEGGGMDMDAIAGDLIAAVKAGDSAGVAAALRASHEACSSYEGEE